jgi:hypothetical protein
MTTNTPIFMEQLRPFTNWSAINKNLDGLKA